MFKRFKFVKSTISLIFLTAFSSQNAFAGVDFNSCDIWHNGTKFSVYVNSSSKGWEYRGSSAVYQGDWFNMSHVDVVFRRTGGNSINGNYYAVTNYYYNPPGILPQLDIWISSNPGNSKRTYINGWRADTRWNTKLYRYGTHVGTCSGIVNTNNLKWYNP